MTSEDLDDQPSSARPSLLLAQKETALAVQAALDSLAPRQRAAISLVYYQGLLGTETAAVLDIEIEAVVEIARGMNVAERRRLALLAVEAKGGARRRAR